MKFKRLSTCCKNNSLLTEIDLVMSERMPFHFQSEGVRMLLSFEKNTWVMKGRTAGVWLYEKRVE